MFKLIIVYLENNCLSIQKIKANSHFSLSNWIKLISTSPQSDFDRSIFGGIGSTRRKGSSLPSGHVRLSVTKGSLYFSNIFKSPF